jgi:hypothetical protein
MNYKCEIFNLSNHSIELLFYVVDLIDENLGKRVVIDYQSMQPGDGP